MWDSEYISIQESTLPPHLRDSKRYYVFYLYPIYTNLPRPSCCILNSVHKDPSKEPCSLVCTIYTCKVIIYCHIYLIVESIDLVCEVPFVSAEKRSADLSRFSRKVCYISRQGK